MKGRLTALVVLIGLFLAFSPGQALASYDWEITISRRPETVKTSGEDPTTWPSVLDLQRTTNRDDPSTQNKKLLYSNSPETFLETDHILYNSNVLTLADSQDHRIVYHHKNGTGSGVKLAVVVENVSPSQEAIVSSPRYGKYHYSYAARAGAEAITQYFVGIFTFSDQIIPAGAFLELPVSQVMSNGHVGSLLCDLHFHGDIRVYVVTMGSSGNAATLVQAHKDDSDYYSRMTPNTQRGDFTTTDVFFHGTLTPDTRGDWQIAVGSGGFDAYATGYDHTAYVGEGFQTLYGNYGVLYTFSYYVPAWESSDRMFIGLNPRASDGWTAMYGTRDIDTCSGTYMEGPLRAQIECEDGGNYGDSQKYIWWQWSPPLGTGLPFRMLHTAY